MRTRRAVRARAVLVAAGAAWIAGPALAAEAVAPPERFSAIVVDTSRVLSYGSARTADLLERQLGAEARQVFADRLTPGDRRAPTLVIHVDSLSLASYAGDTDRTVPGAGNTDYLEGEGIVTAGGQTLSSTHVLSALDAGYSGAWYSPDIDDRRVASISHHFAYWLRRQMGL